MKKIMVVLGMMLLINMANADSLIHNDNEPPFIPTDYYVTANSGATAYVDPSYQYMTSLITTQGDPAEYSIMPEADATNWVHSNYLNLTVVYIANKTGSHANLWLGLNKLGYTIADEKGATGYYGVYVFFDNSTGMHLTADNSSYSCAGGLNNAYVANQVNYLNFERAGPSTPLLVKAKPYGGAWTNVGQCTNFDNEQQLGVSLHGGSAGTGTYYQDMTIYYIIGTSHNQSLLEYVGPSLAYPIVADPLTVNKGENVTFNMEIDRGTYDLWDLYAMNQDGHIMGYETTATGLPPGGGEYNLVWNSARFNDNNTIDTTGTHQVTVCVSDTNNVDDCQIVDNGDVTVVDIFPTTTLSPTTSTTLASYLVRTCLNVTNEDTGAGIAGARVNAIDQSNNINEGLGYVTGATGLLNLSIYYDRQYNFQAVNTEGYRDSNGYMRFGYDVPYPPCWNLEMRPLNGSSVTYTLSGRVTDQNGSAINGALVSVSGCVYESELTVDGNYSFTGISSGGQCIVEAGSIAGYQDSQPFNVGVLTQDTYYAFSLVRTGIGTTTTTGTATTLQGKVTKEVNVYYELNEIRYPAIGASVSAKSDANFITCKKTNDYGISKCQGAYPGIDYEYTVSLTSFDTTKETASNDVVSIEITKSQRYSQCYLAGSVSMNNGTDIYLQGGARLTLYDCVGNQLSANEELSDANGAYELNGYTQCDECYKVTAEYGDFSQTVQVTTVDSEGGTTANIVINNKEATRSGQVTDIVDFIWELTYMLAFIFGGLMFFIVIVKGMNELEKGGPTRPR